MSKARVVIVTCSRAMADLNHPDPGLILAMMKKGLQVLSGAPRAEEALGQWFRPGETVGLKVNCIGRRALSTNPETALALGLWLGRAVCGEENVIIWDRTDEELKEAGYKIATSPSSLKIFGTDNRRAGYQSEPMAHRHLGSLFSRIQAELVQASISLALLKDHGLAGVTAGLKNYFGAIHNPNKYHDSNCDPYIAELFETRPIREKHRLTILDALRVQYHRGPSYHPQWLAPARKFIFSLDPVAADAVGWKLIEELRSKKGLPSLKEEGREPGYLLTAERLNLGQARLENIEIIEAEV